MKKMIYINGSLFDSPRMEKPETEDFLSPYNEKGWAKAWGIYNQWLSSEAKIVGDHSFEEGRVYKEGVDFEKIWRCACQMTHQQEYEKCLLQQCRKYLVAIPIKKIIEPAPEQTSPTEDHSSNEDGSIIPDFKEKLAEVNYHHTVAHDWDNEVVAEKSFEAGAEWAKEWYKANIVADDMIIISELRQEIEKLQEENKKQAIDFTEWIRKKRPYSNLAADMANKWLLNDNYLYTTEELYNLFQQENKALNNLLNKKS
jgi:hypothetical protein